MTTNWHIRPFCPDDQANARALIEEGLAEHFGVVDRTLNPDIHDIGATFGCERCCFVVVERDGELIGTGGLLAESAEACRIVRISVSSQERRQGLGRVIVQHLIETAKAHAFDRMLVETNDDWQAAIRLYHSLGFETVAVRDGEIHMQLALR